MQREMKSKIIWHALAKCLCLVAAVVLSIGMIPAQAFAEKGGNDTSYTYTITVYSGNQATFSGGSTEDKITGKSIGDVVSLADYVAQAQANLKDSNKYYVRGVRESGKDNNTVASPAFKVNDDREYVIAYGIKGDMVKYTVNYQDENGNALLDSDTFYGAVGDKPVVTFRYVDSYRPNAYNLTKTLSANEADNVLTFTYKKISSTNNNTNTDDDETDNNGGNDNGGNGNGGNGNGTNAGGNNATTGNGGNTANANGTANAGTATRNTNDTNDDANADNGDTDETPQDTVDLDDDEEVPQSNIDASENATKHPLGKVIVLAVIAGVAIIAIIALIVLMRKSNKRKRR